MPLSVDNDTVASANKSMELRVHSSDEYRIAIHVSRKTRVDYDHAELVVDYTVSCRRLA